MHKKLHVKGLSDSQKDVRPDTKWAIKDFQRDWKTAPENWLQICNILSTIAKGYSVIQSLTQTWLYTHPINFNLY